MSASISASNDLDSVLERALQKAVRRRQQFCEAEQVLEILLEDMGEARALGPLAQELDHRNRLPFTPPFAELSRAVRLRALPAARELAAAEGAGTVEPRHMLHALLAPTGPIRETLRDRVLVGLRSRRMGSVSDSAALEPAPIGAGALPSSAARSASDDSTRAFLAPLEFDSEDEMLAPRDAALERLAQTLLFGSAVLVGAPGSGRRSLVRLLVRAQHNGRLPKTLLQAPLLSLDLVRLVAGTSYRGELEERVQRVLEELHAMPGPVVLVIEDIHLLVGTGASGGALDVASALIEPLRRGRVRVLGTTTVDAHREVIERHTALHDVLTQVFLSPPADEALHAILAAGAERAGREFGVAATSAALVATARLVSQHLPQVALPGCAVRLLRSAMSRHAFELQMLDCDPERRHADYWGLVGSTPGDLEAGISDRHVMVALSQLHGLPLDHLESGVSEKLSSFADTFRATLFGQDAALPSLEKTLKVALRNLSDPRRPRGRLFLLGPPGVGKTECARMLARHLHGREDDIVRLDMSEFQEPSSVSTLIGSDKGLVGSEEGGRLTEPLRLNPHRVVLLDEFEKAHPNVYNLFLQILDNGEIHDKRGHRVSFRHAILVFTSNAGVAPGLDLRHASRAEIVALLSRVFRPEFLNRIESFVAFRGLDASARRRVVQFQLERFARQLRGEQSLTLTWSDAVLDLAGAPPEGEVGARHVLRWMEQDLKPVVADALEAAKREQQPRLHLEVGTDGILEARRPDLKRGRRGMSTFIWRRRMAGGGDVPPARFPSRGSAGHMQPLRSSPSAPVAESIWSIDRGRRVLAAGWRRKSPSLRTDASPICGTRIQIPQDVRVGVPNSAGTKRCVLEPGHGPGSPRGGKS